MLNAELWASFDQGLTASDIVDIESNIAYLQDEMLDLLAQSVVEDVSSELDMVLHIYLQHFCLSGNERLSPWLIHDAWFYYYADGKGLNYELKIILAKIFEVPDTDLLQQVKNILRCIGCVNLIEKEVDAAVWLTFLDHMVSQLIYQIGRNRLAGIFGSG